MSNYHPDHITPMAWHYEGGITPDPPIFLSVRPWGCQCRLRLDPLRGTDPWKVQWLHAACAVHARGVQEAS